MPNYDVATLDQATIKGVTLLLEPKRGWLAAYARDPKWHQIGWIRTVREGWQAVIMGAFAKSPCTFTEAFVSPDDAIAALQQRNFS